MKNNLALFDLDGTLFDTLNVNFEAYNEALGNFGFSVSEEYFKNNCFSKSYKEFLPSIIGEVNLNLIPEIHRSKKKIYPKWLYKARVNDYLFDLIDIIKATHYIALVTTASRVNCMQILSEFSKDSCFDLVISQEDVVALKPDPECYLKAIDSFSVSKSRVTIYEDSEVGLQAAEKAQVGTICKVIF
jgi:beta-phosphoglucomutase